MLRLCRCSHFHYRSSLTQWRHRTTPSSRRRGADWVDGAAGADSLEGAAEGPLVAVEALGTSIEPMRDEMRKMFGTRAAGQTEISHQARAQPEV